MAYSKYSIKSDVWSFGILLAEIITYGKKPYQGLTNREVVQKLEEGFRMPQPPGCPDGGLAWFGLNCLRFYSCSMTFTDASCSLLGLFPPLLFLFLSGIYKIMLDCWKPDPVERPTFESLVYRLEDFFHSGYGSLVIVLAWLWAISRALSQLHPARAMC